MLRNMAHRAIPKGGFFQGICPFLRFAREQTPRFARDDSQMPFSAATSA
jgi:hypothetical protein